MLDLLLPQPVILGCTFVFALCVGSFLNVVIHRLPIMMYNEWQDAQKEIEDEEHEPDTYNLSVPPSTCPSCNHLIRWYENIPLISYIRLGGKCSSCNAHISLRYPLVELLSAVCITYVIYIFGLNEIGIAAALFSWGLICLTFIDIDHKLLPDNITLPLLWLGLLVNSFNLFTSLESAVYGAIIGYLSLWLVFHAFRLVTGKEGMGYGDFKLLAALGAWCGAAQLPLIVLLSSLAGAIFGLALVISGLHKKQNPIPFGPYLAIAGWISLVYGNSIMKLYLGVLGV